MYRTVLLAIVTALLAACSSPPKPELSQQDVEKVLGVKSSQAMKWSKVQGPDFSVYHGIPPTPGRDEVGFYLGGHPAFEPKPGSTRHTGRLGTHKVTWHRKKQADGSIYQTTVFELRKNGLQIHAWVVGDNVSEAEELSRQLGTARIFSKGWPSAN